ncbi:virulence RhuM family protein [Clostridium algidicarnis]|nr:virulence RhuM family protein [Clostridium algidicarnis]
MEQFANSVAKFLELNEYKILAGNGRISKAQADKKSVEEYNEYNKMQPIQSDFDKYVKKILGTGNNEK